MSRFVRGTLSFVMLAACFVAAACTTEKVVFRDGSNFAAPSAAAASFIGYYDNANKRTVCGSCHIDAQTRWSTTKWSCL